MSNPRRICLALALFLLAVPLSASGQGAEAPPMPFTHGPDPRPAAGPNLGAGLPDPGLACVSADDAHLKILYVLPRDASGVTLATGYTSRLPLMVAGMLNANAILYANAQMHGVEMRLKTLCDENGLPAIEQVQISMRTNEVNFWDMMWELSLRGYGGADEKVLVFYDGSWDWCGCGGWAYIPGGDEPGPSNANNFGWWSYAGIFIGNYGIEPAWPVDEVILHEVTHMMGGVQMSAPHSSGGWHCNDGWDIMCYADGGSTSNYGTSCFPVGETYPALTHPYDCGNDDYFHPNPAPESYLDTHWNVGASYNRFLSRE